MRSFSRLPTPLDLGPFSVPEATGWGVPRSRLRRSDLETPFRGVRSETVPRSLLDLMRAYLPLLGASSVFSHASAAAAWGLWLPRRVTRDLTVDVLAIAPARPPRMVGVRGHQGDSAIPVELVNEIPVVAATLAWRQLADVLTVDELVAAGDSLVRRKNPVCVLGQLAEAVSLHRGRRGVARLASAFPQVRGGADSPKETELRLLLHRAGLPEPAVNAVVSRPGERLRYGDLVFEEWRVIAEYDGEHHRRDPKQYAADIERLEELSARGWIIVRILNAHFGDPELIVARVVAALRSRGWRGRVSRSQLWRTPPQVP